MILSVGICTLPVRIDSFSSLVKNLNNQIQAQGFQNQVEILSIMDCKKMTVGEKRNAIKRIASGRYLLYIDDDDRIEVDFLPSIMNGILTSNADVITFRGEYTEGARKVDWMITSASNLADTNTMLYRKPNHLCAVKREIYEQCHFTDKNYGEDSDYADQINKLIKTEFHIPRKLYFYDFNIEKSQTHPRSKNSAFQH
jgi:glycosyltransferase involved in cell wall biosynthesis